MANSREVAQALHPELRDVMRQFEELRRTASRITDGLTPEQLEWKSAPNAWSIAECLSHLNVTADQYYPAIDRSMRDARERGLVGEGPFRYGFLVNQFIRMMEPPARRRMKAPQVFRPRARGLAAEVPNFFVHQDAIEKRIREANGLDLARAKLTSPVSRLLRMSLGQCFRLLAAHERRHLWQAGNVRRALPDSEK